VTGPVTLFVAVVVAALFLDLLCTICRTLVRLWRHRDLR
jgi:hypothetical protein